MTSFAARVARVLHVTLPDGAAMVERTTMIARVLYILGAAQLTGGWVGLRMHQDILLQPLTRPLPWKMWFLRAFETIDGLRMGVAAAGLLFLFGTIGAIVNPWWRPARIAFTLGLVASAGIRFAMNGKIDHPLHALMWATFVLVFLPPRALVEAEPAARRAMLHVLWCAHAMVLLLYSMAGFSKVTEGLLARLL